MQSYHASNLAKSLELETIPQTIPALCGPLFQPNDLFHAYLKGIFYRELREGLGLQRCLQLRTVRDAILRMPRSGLQRGLTLTSVCKALVSAWHALPQSTILAAWVAFG